MTPDWVWPADAASQATVRDAVRAHLATGALAVLRAAGGSYLLASADGRAALLATELPPLAALPYRTALDEVVRDPSPLAVRLARRCLPGPIHLQLADAAWLDGAAAPVALARPAHPLIDQMLADTAAPLWLAELPHAADQWPANVRIIDDAQAVNCSPPTVVELRGVEYRAVRAGAFELLALRRQTLCLMLFVCTGNTCRSPMVAAVAKQLLAEKLGCSIDDLPAHGYWIGSAGLAAASGYFATPEAVEACRARGLQLDDHRSRPVAPELLAQADVLIAMTRSHTDYLNAWPLATAPQLLARDGSDLADPIGGELAVYERCLDDIHRYLREWLASWFDGVAAPIIHPTEVP